MTTEKKVEETNLLVDFDDFSKYLNSFNKKFECPICDQHDWTLAVPSLIEFEGKERHISPGLMTISIDKASDEPKSKKKTIAIPLEAFALILMECDNCGYTHSFNLRTVKENLLSGSYTKPLADNSEE